MQHLRSWATDPCPLQIPQPPLYPLCESAEPGALKALALRAETTWTQLLRGSSGPVGSSLLVYPAWWSLAVPGLTPLVDHTGASVAIKPGLCSTPDRPPARLLALGMSTENQWAGTEDSCGRAPIHILYCVCSACHLTRSSPGTCLYMLRR